MVSSRTEILIQVDLTLNTKHLLFGCNSRQVGVGEREAFKWILGHWGDNSPIGMGRGELLEEGLGSGG